MINQPDPRTTDYSPSRETVNPGLTDDTVRSATTDGSYVESRHANYVDPAGNQVENQVEVYQDKNQSRANRRSWISTIVSFLIKRAGNNPSPALLLPPPRSTIALFCSCTILAMYSSSPLTVSLMARF